MEVEVQFSLFIISKDSAYMSKLRYPITTNLLHTRVEALTPICS